MNKENETKISGTLYLCATPIGNLEDITYRVLRILKEVDVIACEDTRNSRKLFNHFEITTPYTSYHEFNKYEKGIVLIEQLKKGRNIALISDAGTPGISDPGEELVAMCITNGIEVIAAPGAAAFVSAVILSGMSTKRFAFEGFLPPDKKKRKNILNDLKNDTHTLIFYEAPHRLQSTLKSLQEAFGNRRVSIAKELTKKYEAIRYTTIEEALTYYEENNPRGEYVIVVEGKEIKELKKEEKERWEALTIEEHMEYYLEDGLDKKGAMKAVAKDRGLSKRDIYKYLL